MGLDIYHNKLVSKRPSAIGYSNDGIFLEEKFGNFEEPYWRIVEPFVTKVDYYNCVKTVFFSTVPSEVAFLKRELKTTEILTAKNQSDLEKEIEAFEKQQGLAQHYKEVKNTVPPWNTVSYFEKEIKVGFYTEMVGYQKRGMTKQFWNMFDYEKRHHYYFDKKDFLKAFSCVGYCWESDSAEDVRFRRQAFQNQFIDNFEEGRSFMEFSF